MRITLRIVLAVLIVIYLIMIIKRIRKKQIQFTTAAFWILIGIILIIADIFPGLVISVSKLLGFDVAANMIMVITIFVAYWLLFRYQTKFEKEREKTKRLIQEVSLLKKRVSEIDGKTDIDEEE